jgi:hypothetical protein
MKREPYELITDPDYFRRVISRMTPPGRQGRDLVRFGNDGKGINPNFQVYKGGATGEKLAYRGSNGELDAQHKEYVEEHLSPGFFNYEGVQQLLAGVGRAGVRP